MYTIEMFHIRILFLPLAYLELNPIEMFWSNMKRGIVKTNTTFRLSYLEDITRNAVASMTAEEFSRYVERVKTVQEKLKSLIASDQAK